MRPTFRGVNHFALNVTDLDWSTTFDTEVFSLVTVLDFGHHLNFRDPDNIALEMSAPTETFTELIDQLRSGTVSDTVLLDRAEDSLGPGLVVPT